MSISDILAYFGRLDRLAPPVPRGIIAEQDANAPDASTLPLTRPEARRARPCEPDPGAAGAAEAGAQGGPHELRPDPSRPARLRADGEGLRHAAGRSSARPRARRPPADPVSDLAGQDHRRAVRATARRAGRAVQLLTAAFAR